MKSKKTLKPIVKTWSTPVDVTPESNGCVEYDMLDTTGYIPPSQMLKRILQGDSVAQSYLVTPDDGDVPSTRLLSGVDILPVRIVKSKPVDDKSVDDKLVDDKPVDDKPVDDKPVDEKE